MSRWVRVASVEECAEGELLGVVADGMEVCLANVQGTICALRDQCSHDAFPLSDGELDGDQVICIYHGARFNACTGERTALPAIRNVDKYPVEVRDGEIFVDLG